MRVLLDECVPFPLAKGLTGYECRTVQDQGWKGLKNGPLLTKAQSDFDVLLTSDQNVRYQQNIHGYDIAVVVLSTNSLRRLEAALHLIFGACRGEAAGSDLCFSPLR